MSLKTLQDHLLGEFPKPSLDINTGFTDIPSLEEGITKLTIGIEKN